jgi:hypothetical protein
LSDNESASREELEHHTGKSRNTIIRRINHLISLNVVEQDGERNNPNRKYMIRKWGKLE